MSQVILVSGASQGIGLSIAHRLHAAGHQVFGTSRRPQAAGELPFALIELDVNVDQSVETAVAQVLETTGKIDILINNAGYDLYGAAEETTLAEVQAQLNTNFLGTVRLIQALLPHMRAQGSGKIINMSSIGGYLALPYNSAYAASKFAVEGYSEALRLELQPFNISVSLVEPGAVATDTLDTSIVSTHQDHPAYQKQRAAMVQHMRTMGRNSPVTPQAVADTVAEIVAAHAPKLRYPVGSQARLLPWMKQLIPQRLFERFMRRQFAVA